MTGYTGKLLGLGVAVFWATAAFAASGTPADKSADRESTPFIKLGPDQTLRTSEPKTEKTKSPSTEAEDTSLLRLPLVILIDQRELLSGSRPVSRGNIPWAAAALSGSFILLAAENSSSMAYTGAPSGPATGFNRQVQQFSGNATHFGVAGAFYLVGKLGNNSRARQTGILSLRALTNSFILANAARAASRRPPTFLESGEERLKRDRHEISGARRSFPSGNASQAWALASVMAHQYGHHRWAPAASYGLASLVSITQAAERKRFPTDVVVGSVLGYLIGHHLVGRANDETSGEPSPWGLSAYVPERGGAAVELICNF